MDDDVSQPPTAPEKASVSADQNGSGTVSKKRRGVLSRIWNGIFSKRNEDFEKKLQHLSKEEASIHARMKRRAQRWRKTARNLMVFSVILEVAAVAYAIMSTRSFNLNWKMRAARVFPMFALPAFSSLIYSALVNFTRMCDRKDQKTLERLRTERQEKINELKERTNYYITQQLIQRYDPDPAAKAAAASVLASKLGAESGLKVHLGDESYLNAPFGKSSDIEWVQSRGLRNRKPLSKTSSTASSELQQLVEEMPHDNVHDSLDSSAQNQAVFVEHHPRSATNEGGWIARVAALLVGEDPTQCYALICGNCHMHNGLARKEDFAYITYYCPHCNVLNGSRQPEEPGSVSNSKPSSPASVTSDANSNASISGATSNSAAAAMGTSVKKDDLKELNAPAS